MSFDDPTLRDEIQFRLSLLRLMTIPHRPAEELAETEELESLAAPLPVQ